MQYTRQPERGAGKDATTRRPTASSKASASTPARIRRSVVPELDAPGERISEHAQVGEDLLRRVSGPLRDRRRAACTGQHRRDRGGQDRGQRMRHREGRAGPVLPSTP